MKYFKQFMSVFLASILFLQCAKKGRSIAEPRFGIYNFTTYTIDTFRFRVSVNGQVLTDSLQSPLGVFSKPISFYNPEGTIQLIDLRNNSQLVLDTAITLKTGTHFLSIVQLLKGQKPFIPGPPAGEPLPAIGKYKVRFQYTTFVGEPGFPAQNFFYDSVRVIVRLNGLPVDTLVLRKYDFTPFYEAGTGGAGTFSLAIRNPVSGTVIDASTSPSVGNGYNGFNTVSVSGRLSNDWILTRMY